MQVFSKNNRQSHKLGLSHGRNYNGTYVNTTNSVNDKSVIKQLRSQGHLSQLQSKFKGKWLSFMMMAVFATTSVMPLQMAHAANMTTAVTDFSDLVSEVTQGVARVNVTKKPSNNELQKRILSEFFRRGFGDRAIIPREQLEPSVEHAYGTAFFVTKDGYMLTNHHVIEDADRITVTLNDRRELDAVVVGSDERSDVAVLKVTGKNFPALPIGASKALRVGEPVLAIGSPFGFDYSASAGIVSAKSRNFSRENTVPFIQTDVALNPGNSGGPLFNRKGEVIGINSRIFSGTGGYMGLSFSIPIDNAMDIYEQLKESGEVMRAYMGVHLQDIDRNLAEAYKLAKPTGVLLTQVAPNSPASQAGLKSGDIVLKYNQKKIADADAFINSINEAHPDDKFTLLIQRNGKQKTVKGILIELPDDKDTEAKTSKAKRVYLGLKLRALFDSEETILKNMDNLNYEGGVLITAVNPTGLAARSGLQKGDVITSIDQKTVKDIKSFVKAIEDLPESGVVVVNIIRRGVPTVVGMRLEKAE